MIATALLLKSVAKFMQREEIRALKPIDGLDLHRLDRDCPIHGRKGLPIVRIAWAPSKPGDPPLMVALSLDRHTGEPLAQFHRGEAMISSVFWAEKQLPPEAAFILIELGATVEK